MTSILITGGTGSFGRAFVSHLLVGDDFDRIIVLSRGEHAQAAMAQDFVDRRMRYFIGDVRDRDRLCRAFDGVDVVVHAAALKRIEVGHYNPDEMVKTNVIGAMNVIEAAVTARVSKVVGISSDKAWMPVSPYGQSKALAETLLLNANNMSDGRSEFVVVRYGNVAGSAGSVIPKWRQMIAQGQFSVPVSDPDCTRFWMFMNEAVSLVHRTIKHEKGGKTVVPFLPAYRLGDLATAMGVEMDVKGLPSWEKKHEGMGEGNTSDVARRLSQYELQDYLQQVS